MMNNLEKHFAAAEQAEALPMPTGTREEVGRELLRRCDERDRRLERQALEAERDGDHDGCWMAMATRAHNQRVRDHIAAGMQEAGAKG